MKRRTVYSRMFRPVSAAFSTSHITLHPSHISPAIVDDCLGVSDGFCVSDLEFDVSKALEEVSMHVDDLPPPPPMSPLMSPPPVEVGLHLPQLECFGDLPSVDTPALQHVTKSRPRRTKKAKASRAAVRCVFPP